MDGWYPAKRRASGWMVLGGLVGGLPLGLGGELYLRSFLPRDFEPYLGEDSPHDGLFQADPTLGVAYRDWPTLREDYAERFAHYLPLAEWSADGTGWAFFGSSFVQAPGMLADTARARVPDRKIFNLARNEPLYVRFAQIETLLDQGFRPDRIFVTLMPLDTAPLAEHSLDQFYVTQRGALTFKPRIPDGVLGSVIKHSRLALIAWVRTKLHDALPTFH